MAATGDDVLPHRRSRITPGSTRTEPDGEPFHSRSPGRNRTDSHFIDTLDREPARATRPVDSWEPQQHVAGGSSRQSRADGFCGQRRGGRGESRRRRGGQAGGGGIGGEEAATAGMAGADGPDERGVVVLVREVAANRVDGSAAAGTAGEVEGTRDVGVRLAGHRAGTGATSPRQQLAPRVARS